MINIKYDDLCALAKKGAKKIAKGIDTAADAVIAVSDEIRENVTSVRERDPAARSNAEILLLYSGVHAILAYRVAHKLYLGKKYFPARAVSQLARFFTGIEIHPGATIGHNLFIDHGSGVVIGENCVVRDSIIMKGTVIGDNTTVNKAIIAENCFVGVNCELGVFDEVPNSWKPDIYTNGMVTIGENSIIPDRVRIGKNTAISGGTTVDDYPRGILPSGENIIKAGDRL